jgi:hypothetical chaperone protein
MSVGIDFGTTNSVAAVVSDDGKVRVARHGADRASGNFRSILCFVQTGPRMPPRIVAGPDAMAAYLDYGSDCRLIQSVKSMAANPHFSSTLIFGRRYSVEELISLILKGLRISADGDQVPLGSAVTAGRPVRFAGLFADETLALKRLTEAFALAGFEEVGFVAEPLAAAYKFASRISSQQLCVVADFGGGTSDFSLVRFFPGKEGLAMETLGTSGVGLAGDRLDYRIIEHAVCPKLGMGSHYLSMDKRLPIPSHYYARFQRWSDLSFLRTPETLRELRTLKRMAEDPGGLERLIYIIEEELGFDLYQAVSAVKTKLSSEENAVLAFKHGPVQISETITRESFNRWIAPDLAKIDEQVDVLFQEANVQPEKPDVQPGNVQHVFMTGGTSFVPAIRDLMAARFPDAAFSAEDEFISVGAGLALFGRENGISPHKAA